MPIIVYTSLSFEQVKGFLRQYNDKAGWGELIGRLTEQQLDSLAQKVYKDIDEDTQSLYAAAHDMLQFMIEHECL